MNNNIKDLCHSTIVKKRSVALAKAQKKYYEKNKEKLTADQVEYNKKYLKKEVKCECGAVYKMSAKYLHMRSAKHKRRMEKIKNGEDPNLCESMTKFSCECGSLILKRNQKVHEQSDKHIKYIKSI